MLTTRHMSLELEFTHWLLLIVLALALVLVIATALGAGETMPPPKLLPEAIDTWAKPLSAEVPRPFFPESPPPKRLPAAQAAANLWTILDDHRAGRAGEALRGWDDLALPDQVMQWREIARGAAYLETGDLERAQWQLQMAREMAPAHPAAAYFMGLVRLEQAAALMRVPDGRRMMDFLVAAGPRDERLRYELLAIAELEMAITQSALLVPAERLLDVDAEAEESLIVPTAGDLMAALGADRLAGRAHHLLFGIQLKHGNLGPAEYHLDQAAADELPVLYGYQDLAVAYAERGAHSAAIRVFGKGFVRDYPLFAVFSLR